MLIDGHNRHDICQRHGIPFKTVSKSFQDEDEVMDWMDKNQLGRRNLEPQQSSVLRGRIYIRTRKKEHDGGKGKERSGGQNDPSLRTAEKLAAEFGVSPATIKRDAKLAAEVASDPELSAALNDRTEFKKVRRKQKAARQEKRTEAAKGVKHDERIIIGDQRAMIADVVAEIESKLAIVERGKASGRGHKKLEDTAATNLPAKDRTRAKTAKAAKVSERKMRKARAVRKKSAEMAAKVDELQRQTREARYVCASTANQFGRKRGGEMGSDCQNTAKYCQENGPFWGFMRHYGFEWTSPANLVSIGFPE